MTRKEQSEHQRELEITREARRKAKKSFFLEFTKHFRPWLIELTRRYKERGVYPEMACWLLPSYYTDPQDVEVAAFAALLVRDSDRLHEYLGEYRSLFGSSPFQWLKSRGFVSYGTKWRLTEYIGGTNCARAGDYFSRLYDIWWKRETYYPQFMAEFFGEERGLTKERLLRLVLSASDGFGRGLWSTTSQESKCPLTVDVKRFLREWASDLCIRGRNALFTYDEIIGLFGFEKDSDFFYAMLAYRELQRRNPMGCRRFSTLYQKRYEEVNILEPQYWTGRKGILPDLDF